nr:MAG TPA: hypothetical protein [Caudoviricetes sp.]
MSSLSFFIYLLYYMYYIHTSSFTYFCNKKRNYIIYSPFKRNNPFLCALEDTQPK